MGLCPECREKGETLTYVGASKEEVVELGESNDAEDSDLSDCDDAERCDRCREYYIPESNE